MKKNPKRSLIAVQFLSVFGMLAMFGLAWFGLRTMEKIEAMVTGHPASELEAKLRPKIGQSYTQKMHDAIHESALRQDNGIHSLYSGTRSIYIGFFQIAGGVALLSLYSIFSIAKNFRNQDQ